MFETLNFEGHNNNNNINNSDSDNNYNDKEGGKMAGYIANVPEVRWLYMSYT
jgi:hypothetical protein